MRRIVSEKEILEALERQAFLIEQKLNLDSMSIGELNASLPENAMVNLNSMNDLLPKYIKPSFLEKLDLTLDEVLKDPVGHIKKDVYPGDFERAALLVKTHLFGKKPISQSVSFIQRIKHPLTQSYEGIFTLTKPIQKKQNLMGINISLNAIEGMTNKLMRLLEESLYMRNNYHKFASLTPREKEIITLLALGYQNGEIGEQLFISKATVEQHRKNLKRKLEIRRFVDLIRFAQAFDLI
ncbi:response regulator transcription factor [uncultured Microscilla sp.]|uniref:response regulator transcription factor n=1 Tax=uncultured Microscilla sp. TaxID=432653 RepID=UPI002604847E|nr:helix-turn-helix transcriptional regulator [uncultured Microscilla sp.]